MKAERIPIQHSKQPDLQTLQTFASQAKTKASVLKAYRKKHCLVISKHIAEHLRNANSLDLVFICLHNSRRSVFAEVWANYWVLELGLGNLIASKSGGFFPSNLSINTMDALQRAGVPITKDQTSYYFSFEDNKKLSLHSKPVHSVLGEKNTVPVILCADALDYDYLLPPAQITFPLIYADPWEADGLPGQNQVYDQICFQVCMEVYFILFEAKKRYQNPNSSAD